MGRRRYASNFVSFGETSEADLQPGFRNSSGSDCSTSSLRRGAMSLFDSIQCAPDLIEIEQATNGKDWLRSFARLDPRMQMLNFFNDLSCEGVEHFESEGANDCRRRSLDIPKLLRGFTKSGMFTVWRPTSPDAIRHMITGKGTGKGLDIKGKSAIRGPYSGFVPFLQISDNSHKNEIGPLNLQQRVRVFYPNKVSRDSAFSSLVKLSKPMLGQSLTRTRNTLKESAKFFMIDPKVYKIDDYAFDRGVYGIDVPEKVLWQGYVLPVDITRPEGSKYDTGRQSIPAFQQMNIETLRGWKDEKSDAFHCEADPRPVLWHAGCDPSHNEEAGSCDPLCPQGLLMAYEEGGKVTPVLSDFDCFLLGTRGVKYEQPFGDKELSMLSWCIEEINDILSTPKENVPWTSRWLDVKKKLVQVEGCGEGGSFCQEMPKFGYADPRSYSIIKGAVRRLRENGAVRHGPECFNYAFPQELDNQFLVISDTFPDVPWRYVGPDELIDILCDKIDEGFTFPLNPKWILCDPGWKRVYDKLLASQKPNVQDSMSIWYPCEIRRRIDEISTNFPRGFVYAGRKLGSTRTRASLAAFELRKLMICASGRKLILEDSELNDSRCLPKQLKRDVSILHRVKGSQCKHHDDIHGQTKMQLRKETARAA